MARRTQSLLRTILLLLASSASALGADLADWEGRTIYFVVTDRFARDDAGSTTPNCKTQTKEWCGGTLKGVTRLVESGYISGMGFDALWITPVVLQVPWRDHWNGTGYHGYWARDFNAIDPHLGSAADLRALSAACHKRGMLLMLDVVANHVGPIHSVAQLRQLAPELSSPKATQIHTLGRGANETLEAYIAEPVEMQQAGARCFPWYNFGNGGCNYTVILDGWFGDLADLRQENEATASYLLAWIARMVKDYSIDGLRLDTALYMPKPFLARFQEASGVLILGEVVTLNHTMHRSFVPPLSSLLNFPVALLHKGSTVWGHGGDGRGGNASMAVLAEALREQAAQKYPNPTLLGNFVDNHDGPRFLFNHSGDEAILRNALTFVLLYHGLPIVYYGTEQPAMAGLPAQRAAMWPHYGTDTPTCGFLRDLHRLRRAHGLAHAGDDATTEAGVLTSASAGDDANRHLTFVRGSLLVRLSNVGAAAAAVVPGAGAAAPESCFALSDLGPRWTWGLPARRRQQRGGPHLPRRRRGSARRSQCRVRVPQRRRPRRASVHPRRGGESRVDRLAWWWHHDEVREDSG